MRFDFRGKRFERTLRSSAPPSMINDGIPQDAVKPRYGRFVLPQSVEAFEPSGKSILQDVFRKGSIANPTFEETQELSMIFNENLRRMSTSR